MLIKHFWNGKTITETEEKLKNYYGDSAPSHSMVHTSGLQNFVVALWSQQMQSVLKVIACKISSKINK